jgi:hypothetical protein
MERVQVIGALCLPPLRLRPDRADEQPVYRIDVSVAVEQHVGGGYGHMQVARRIQRFAQMQVRKHIGSVAQVAGDVSLDESGLGEAAGTRCQFGAELGRAREGSDASHGIPPLAGKPGSLLQRGGDLLVGADGGFGEMPRAVLGLISEGLGEREVRPAALDGG